MVKALNLQDVFLNGARKDKIKVSVNLINGGLVEGTVQGFDNFTVVMECEGKQHLVYKHSISSIVPKNQINIFISQKENQG